MKDKEFNFIGWFLDNLVYSKDTSSFIKRYFELVKERNDEHYKYTQYDAWVIIDEMKKEYDKQFEVQNEIRS